MSRVQKVDKTAILQVQKSKGQITQNIKSAKGRKPDIAGAKMAKVKSTCGFRPFALLIFWVV